MVILLLLTLPGCGSRRSTESRPANEQTSANETPSGNESNRTITLDKKGTNQRQESGFSTREPEIAFFPYSLRNRHLPEDFEIGRLQDFHTTSQVERRIVEVVERFCEGLTQSTLAVEMIEEPKRSLLNNSLSHYLEQNILPDTYRIGAVSENDGVQAVVPVRLFSDTGVTEGHIYLSNTTERWLISDLQTNMQELSKQYVPRDGKYTPSHYGWRLNGY